MVNLFLTPENLQLMIAWKLKIKQSAWYFGNFS